MRIRTLLAAFAVAIVVLAPASAAYAAQEGEPQFADKQAEECSKLLAEGTKVDACQEAPSPILPATNELVWGAISFIVVFTLLGKFAYPAIKKSMEERTNKIREGLDDAERTRTEADKLLA